MPAANREMLVRQQSIEAALGCRAHCAQQPEVIDSYDSWLVRVVPTAVWRLLSGDLGN